MIEPCSRCSSERVAAVVYKRMLAAHRGGNPYRKRCLGCDTWLTFCKKGEYETADIQHVLPRDADPQAQDPTVPVEEYPGRIRNGVGRVRTDGGDSPDISENPENVFACPRCAREVRGEPDCCPYGDCAVEYDWSGASEDSDE